MEGTTTKHDDAYSQFMIDYAESMNDAMITDDDVMIFAEESTINLPNCHDFDRFAKHLRHV